MRFFWEATRFPFREVFRGERDLHGRLLVRAVYGYVLYFLIFRGLPKVAAWLAAPHDDPLWPVAWMAAFPWVVGVWTIAIAAVAGALLATVFPGTLVSRVWIFIGLFEFLALWYSYTGVQHRTYIMLTATFFFALMPGWRSPERANRSMLMIWGALAFCLFAYTVAGILKIEGILHALHHGDVRVLDLGQVPIHLLSRAYKFENPLFLSEFILNNPAMASWGYFFAIYLETASLLVAFRPHLLRAWLVALIGFHFLTELSIGVFFVSATVTLTLFAIFSPFSCSWRHWRATIREIPWFGPFLATAVMKIGLLVRRESVDGAADDRTMIIYYDGNCGLCNRFVRFCLSREVPENVFFSSLQGPRFEKLKAEHAYLRQVDSLVVHASERGEESIRLRSEAVLWVLARFRGWVGWLFFLLLIPLPVLNLIYRAGAALRRRMDVTDSCAIPGVKQRGHFV